MGKREVGSIRTRSSIPPASEIPPRARTRTSMPPAIGRRVVETAVVTAAVKVFTKRGYASARVEDILDEAGIARRTFYRYFTSKDDVLVVLHDLAVTDLQRRLGGEGDEGPAGGSVVALVDRFLDYHVENAALCRVLAAAIGDLESPITAARRRLRAELVRRLVALADARGAVPIDGFGYVALAAALQGVAADLLEAGTSVEDVARAKRALHAVLERGLDGPTRAT